MGNSERSGQAALIGPRLPSPLPTGYNHIMKVRWRWQNTASGSSSTFYYGAIDSAGAIYYLETGNGAMPHVVHKIDPTSGFVLWVSTPPPSPYYANFYGNDHLIVWKTSLVIVVAGTTYTLADCAWVQALDGATGKQLWWLNGTSTIINAALASDGSQLYAAFYNGSVTVLNPTNGGVLQHWDLSHSLGLSSTSTMAVVPVPQQVNHLPHHLLSFAQSIVFCFSSSSFTISFRIFICVFVFTFAGY